MIGKKSWAFWKVLFLTPSIKYAYGIGGTIMNSLIGHKFGKLTVIK